MLVLSRQRDETIMIGDEVEVTVVDIRGDKVRLGITAPKEVTVHRKEVYEAIKRENRAAAQVRPEDLPGTIGQAQRQGPRLVDHNRPQVQPTVRVTSPQPPRPPKPDRPARQRRSNGGSAAGKGHDQGNASQQPQEAHDSGGNAGSPPSAPPNGE